MITYDITFDGRKPGIRLLKKRIARLSKKQMPVFKKKVLTESGKKAKRYMVQNIDSEGINFTGSLRRSIRRRTMLNKVTLWVAHGGAAALELGYRPHWIHRDMIGGGGYKVGRWMDAKGMKGKNFVFVGTGKTGKGIRFVSRAYDRLNSEFPLILKNNLKELNR